MNYLLSCLWWTTAGVKGEEDLENFNVRVFYDKLEDQNLHLASQLARQQEDLRNFYEKMCAQNEELKNLLQNMDPGQLEALEARMATRGKGAGDINIVNANIGGASKYKFAGTVFVELSYGEYYHNPS